MNKKEVLIDWHDKPLRYNVCGGKSRAIS